MSRSMLVHAQLEKSLWAEAIATAAYLRNRCPTTALSGKTPYEAWYGWKPKVKHLKVFGSCAVALNKRAKPKFEAKGKQYVMIGYSSVAKAYRLYDKDTRSVVERRDVWFEENTFDICVSSENKANNISDDFLIIVTDESQKQSQSLSIPTVEGVIIDGLRSEDEGEFNTADEEESAENTVTNENIIEETQSQEENSDAENDTQEMPRRGRGRPKIIRDGRRGRPRKEYNVINGLSAKVSFIPQTPEEAISIKNSSEWKNAMQTEFNALEKNKTWEIVDLPAGKNAIGCKWVYAIKTTKDGDIERYKARLVAKGCSQKYGVNYCETFSPVIRYANIRLLFAIAVNKGMYLHQIDIVSAYLNGDINEEVYMQQPKMFVDKNHPNKVLRLRKSLYGLKQSGREWNAKLDLYLKKIGFTSCDNEPCLYKKAVDHKLVLLALFVDDILIGCRDKIVVQKI